MAAKKRKSRALTPAQRIARMHQRLDRKAQKVGPRPVPLTGEFVSRGVAYALEPSVAGTGMYRIRMVDRTAPVVMQLPPIGLLAASQLMCAFHDAVAAVPPKMVTAPPTFDNTLVASQKARIAQLETMLQNARERHEEARHLLKELVRVALDQVRD